MTRGRLVATSIVCRELLPHYLRTLTYRVTPLLASSQHYQERYLRLVHSLLIPTFLETFRISDNNFCPVEQCRRYLII
jgi:hypothetical protein